MRRRIGTLLLLVASICLNWFALPATPTRAASALQADYWLHYDVDYSQVPSWVRLRALTLKVYVGQAQSVEVIAGGQSLAFDYTPAVGWVVFTTNASSVDMHLQGLSTPIQDIGEVQKAALRDDKRWAYSLTFDDGRETIWTNGKPMLDRLGLTAAVAVIGRWLDEDGIPYGYMSLAELQDLLRAGWGLYNHSFSHYESLAIPGHVVEDVLMCNRAFAHAIQGYQPLVFTVPFNDTLYVDPVVASEDLLRFQVIQVGGGPLVSVDAMNWSSPPFLLGRWDIGRPREANSTRSGALHYIEQAHSVISQDPNVHVWLNMHSHNVATNDIAGSTLDYLYFTYGPGGTNEVWIAPVDEVYQYLAVRDHAIVTQGEAREVSTAYASPRIRQVAFRQGSSGYAGMVDTYITAMDPTKNFNAVGENQVMRLSTPDTAAILMKFDLSSIPSTARILRASLGFYAIEHSNKGEIIAAPYTLRRAWLPSEATWLRATAAQAWGSYGANTTSGASKDRDATATDSRSLRWFKYVDDTTGETTWVDNTTWYSVDVTESVKEWVQQPASNFGLVLKASGDSVELRVASSEYTKPALRPCLVVTYEETGLPAAPSADPGAARTNPAVPAGPSVPPAVNHRILPTTSDEGIASR